jgi:hypothetical protein
LLPQTRRIRAAGLAQLLAETAIQGLHQRGCSSHILQAKTNI